MSQSGRSSPTPSLSSSGGASGDDEQQSVAFRVKILKIVDPKPQTKDDEDPSAADAEDSRATAGDADKIQTTPVTTIEYKGLSLATFKEQTLADLRSKITSVINGSFRFSDIHRAVFHDDMTFATYFSGLDSAPTATEGEAKSKPAKDDEPSEAEGDETHKSPDDKLKPGKKKQPNPKKKIHASKNEEQAKPPSNLTAHIIDFKRENVPATELLDHPPFLLKFVQVLRGDELQREGSLHSSALDTLKGGHLQLGQLRKHVKAISSKPDNHQFCLEDGQAVNDTMTLREYVASLSKMEQSEGKSTPSIDVYFCKPGITRKEKRKGASEEVKNSRVLQHDKGFKSDQALDVARRTEFTQLQEQVLAANYQIAKTLGDGAKSATGLTEDEWDAVIQNSGIMFGWNFDGKAQRVTRAPKAAFQLRKGLNMGEPSPSWTEPKTTAKASTAKGRGKKKVTTTSTDNAAPGEKSQTPATNIQGTGSATDTAVPTETTSVRKAQAIPNFIVDDASRIEISSVTHEFQYSMASAHFSSESYEASVSGGIGGFSGAASAAHEERKESSDKSSQQTTEKKLIGKYHVPRVTVHFLPGDLEPTMDFKNAVERIKTQRRAEDLRRLHREFGHTFCLRVLLGGSLKTTKTAKLTGETSEHSEKEQFKTDVGVAVQTPYVSAEAKYSQEHGGSSNTGSNKVDIKENLAFEPTGGNTILASDPGRWMASVADHNNWRMIEQADPVPLIQALAQIPGYSEAPQWFLQVVPHSSSFLEIPSSRVLHMRMKAVISPDATDGILRSTKKSENSSPKKGEDPSSKESEANYYLGHEAEKIPEHVRVSLKPKKDTSSPPATSDITDTFLDKLLGTTWKQTVAREKAKRQASIKMWNSLLFGNLTQSTEPHHEAKSTPLFSPCRINAPALFRGIPVSNTDESRKTIYKQTGWRFEIPEGTYLGHESRVIIRSLATDSNPCLSIYRNVEGHFLPGMVNHDTPAFWRILKTDPTSARGDPIRDGDVVKFCWRFSDQTYGFRDFYKDDFGRRRSTKPDDTGDALYIKAPYPPIHAPGSPISLAMSPHDSEEPLIAVWDVLRQSSPGLDGVAYNLHDLTFRLDSAGSDGLSGLYGYLTSRTVETEEPSFSSLIANLLFPGMNPQLARHMMASMMIESPASMKRPSPATASKDSKKSDKKTTDATPESP